ncbi:MAG: hypothetical protein M3Z24_06210 [Chloroflexota bacterium]|nr:hypothetical protein [Chloroflexota bacterium]
MSPILQQRRPKRTTIVTLVIGILAIVLGISIGKILPANPFQPLLTIGRATPSPVWTDGTTTTNNSVSPLLFGTNMSLFDANDQMLLSTNTRTQAQQIHLRIIRMPVRASLSLATEIQAAQAIKNIGAIPLVILRGEVDNTVLADDTRIINAMNKVFGKNVVFYEYGNEEDLLGVDVNRYTSSWNAIIPQLQRIALHGHFIGPVNFQYNRDYLAGFLQQAHPRPDEISWHEYACDDAWANDPCIAHIDSWTTHIQDARKTMLATIGTALPVMITEWNYAPNAKPNDGKNNNNTFMTTWTRKALETLAANRVFASMQYSCTNTAIPLIASDGTITTQGTIFQTLYQQMIINKRQPESLAVLSESNSFNVRNTSE